MADERTPASLANELVACKRALYIIELATLNIESLHATFVATAGEWPADRSVQVARDQACMLIDHIARYRFGDRWLLLKGEKG